MINLPFGKTGIKVSKLGLGLAALGRPGYINPRHGKDLNFNYSVQEMERNAHNMLDEAHSRGIRYIDAARSYGKAEWFLSQWLRNRRKTDVIIGSKWGYTYTADWKVEAEQHEVKEHSPEVLDRQWKESFELLGERLNIYQIHSASLETGVLANKEVINRLWKLKETGLIVGLSLSGARQAETLEKALEAKRDGERLFQSVQATWNILEQSTSESLQSAHDAGMGVIVKEALANGRLTSRSDIPQFPEAMKVLKEMSQKYNTTIDALSIAFVLCQPWVSVVLSGAVTREQLLSNLGSLTVNISKEDSACLKKLAISPEEYWRSRGGLKWN